MDEKAVIASATSGIMRLSNVRRAEAWHWLDCSFAATNRIVISAVNDKERSIRVCPAFR